MKLLTGEYNVELDIPTDNFVFELFTSYHTQYMWDFIPVVEQKITDNTKLIILFGAFENLHEYDHWFEPVNALAAKYKIPTVVFNGRLTKDTWTTVVPQFHYHKISIFDHVSNVNCYEETLLLDYLHHQEKNYKFYWASSKDLYPRRYLLAHLFENNLVSGNLINYKCVISDIPSEYLSERMSTFYCELIAKKCQEINHLIPLPHLDDTIEFNLTDKKFYNDSYIGVITDTFFADYGGQTGVFFSEKIFQAINHHQLFFYIGPPNSLEYLKNQGYYVFDDVFDLSYDKIDDPGQRLIHSVESLLIFLKKPIDEIKQIYNDNAEKILHNKMLLRQQDKRQTIFNLLEKALNEH
jgi:hypothetical protein